MQPARAGTAGAVTELVQAVAFQVCNHPDLFEGRAIVSAYDMPQINVQLPSLAMTIVPDIHDTCQQLSSLGLLPGQLIGKSAVWEAADTAALACRAAEFAAVAGEAAAGSDGFAHDADVLFKAGAAAAVAAGLVPQLPSPAAANGNSSRATNAALAAAAHAADAVRQTHAQLMMTSGAAVALTGVLSSAWQQHSSWRLSRVAHAAALSMLRCGVDVSPSQQNAAAGYDPSSSSSGVVVSGGWLPLDACGVPVGAASRGRFPDLSDAYISNAAARSQLLLPSAAAVAYSSGAGRRAGAAADGSAAAGVGGYSSSSRMPLCGWDLVRAVGGAAHPIAACLKGRMGARALADLSSLVLELSVSPLHCTAGCSPLVHAACSNLTVEAQLACVQRCCGVKRLGAVMVVCCDSMLASTCCLVNMAPCIIMLLPLVAACTKNTGEPSSVCCAISL
jgi:hypothetical protein